MSVEYRIGDVRALLAEMSAGSVDLICTSWPYLEQRDYLAADDPMKALEIGHEGAPAEYIRTLLGITAEFRRVLAPHGSIATELGDKFSDSGGAGGDYRPNGLRAGQPKFRKAGGEGWPLERSLAMIPELYRVALAYGIHPLTGEASPAGRWRVRNVVAHGRPNPPVGALGDKYRPACSYWAVACVNRRWFDLDAVRTEAQGQPNYPSNGPKAAARLESGVDGAGRYAGRVDSNGGAPPLDWFEDECDQFERDLWTIPTFGYKGAHYATFSPQLVKRFLLSMCPARVCRECGKPSKRITGPVTYKGTATRRKTAKASAAVTNGTSQGHYAFPETNPERHVETLGWTDCGHGGNWRPGVVLDPFGGSGTTGMVAAGNGRDCLLFDLDARNLDLARERIGMYLDDLAKPPAEAEPEPDGPEQEAMLL